MLEIHLENPAQTKKGAELLRHLAHEEPQVDMELGMLRLPTQHGVTALIESVRALDAAHIALADIALRRPTLDDVFLALTEVKK